MRRRTAVVAGSAAAFVALTGTVVGVALTRPDGAVPAAAPPPFLVSAKSACGLSGSDGMEGATAATWTDVAGRPLPRSSTDGPGVSDPRGPWSCFTRTEAGAVLAGYVIAMRIELADDRPAVIREQTVPGPGQDVLLASVPNSSEIVTPRGFDVAAYSDDASTIRYRLSTANGEFTCTTDVKWANGDWRLVLGDDGSTSSGCVRGMPTEFTPWGP